MFDVDRAITIDDLREAARRRLPSFAFIPMETGSGNGSGPRRNVEAFGRFHLVAKALADRDPPDQRVALFGRSYAAPFGISAIGYANTLRRNADQMLAAAAAEADIPFMLSGGSTASIEEIARIAPDHTWQQIYAARDESLTDHIIGRAADAGVTVLVYTADSPVPPRNDWLARSGIALPSRVRWSSWPYVLWQATTHPGWSLSHALRGGLPRLESWAPYAPPGASAKQVARLFQSQVPNMKTWAEVERVRRRWSGDLVVKGLVEAGDARRAFDLGADAVTVSNHGGNKLDCMAAAIDYLPGVRDGVDAGRRIFFDGGIRRGADILVAKALGADFSFVARAMLYGVIAGGEKGASKAIAILKEDVARTMALVGRSRIADIASDLVHTDTMAVDRRSLRRPV